MIGKLSITVFSILYILLLSISEASPIGSTCKACHLGQNIADLIKQRQIDVDFNKIPLPDFAFVTNLGGKDTNSTNANSSFAFQRPATDLTDAELALNSRGNLFFDTSFSDGLNLKNNAINNKLSGLGPVYNNNSCQNCHPKDGKASSPVISDTKQYQKLFSSGVFLRVSIENQYSYQGKDGDIARSEANNWGSPIPVPDFGTQLFQRAIQNIKVRDNYVLENGKIDILARQSGQVDYWLYYKYKEISYSDGSTITLSQPVLLFDNPYDAPDDSEKYDINPDNITSQLYQKNVKTSMRSAPAIYGLGLLEAIPVNDILMLENHDILKNNGITGKANWVTDEYKSLVCKKNNSCKYKPPISLGRFGLKASKATIAEQSLGALQGDMGVTNTLFPNEAIIGTKMYNNLLKNDVYFRQHIKNGIESNSNIDKAIIFYAKTLAVPARKISDAERNEIAKGAKLFVEANCQSCHHPKFITGKSNIAVLSQQTIYPFTDMLLHDMGNGLADNRRVFEANGRQWRTAPLWGVGKVQRVNPSSGFLHDGRARTIEEAVLWHGGEAKASQSFFIQLSKQNRKLLIKFLQSL